MPRQARANRHQGGCYSLGIVSTKCTVLEQPAGDRLGEQCKAGGGRQRQSGGNFIYTGLRCGQCDPVVGMDAGRDARNNNRSDGDGSDA